MSGSTGPIFTKFSGIVDLLVQVTDLTFVFWSLNMNVATATKICGEIDEINLPDLQILGALAFQNGLEYRNDDLKD